MQKADEVFEPHPDDIKLFADFKNARLRNGLGMQEVADSMGIDLEYLGDIENAKYDLTMSEIRLLALACDALVEYNLIVGTPPDPKKSC